MLFTKSIHSWEKSESSIHSSILVCTLRKLQGDKCQNVFRPWRDLILVLCPGVLKMYSDVIQVVKTSGLFICKLVFMDACLQACVIECRF